MKNSNTSQPLSRRTVAFIGIIIVAMGVLLGLDLQFRGLAWQFFWSQTGEETPIAQIRGMVEVAGNLIRQQPDTAPLTAINHTHEIPYGINTFLQKEVEEPKIRVMLEMIRDAGFVWLRQEFPWEDLEVDGRGQFTDSRNDYDGDGVKDVIDAWEKYDRIVELTGEYGLRLMVRLSNPPTWTRANPDIGDFAPPDDLQDFVNYAVAVAERYQGRVTHYQIWNEPNIYPEWGEQFADPAAYTDMLCRTYDALKAVDPDIVVISGAIAPTISLDGYVGYQDLLYLQTMYDNGAGECFDVLSAQGYGLFSGPTDRRMRLTSVNYGRHIYYRDIMVRNGDAHKPIWLSEAAWNPVLDAQRPAAEIADFNRFGTVTEEQAARYMPIALQRAQEEWPWIGTISYWFFTRPDPFENDQSFFYFRMVEPDYQPERPTFTPLPVYNSVRDYIANQTPTLYRGVHQAESWQITQSDDAELVAVDGAQFDQAMRADSLSFTTRGTDVILRYQSPEPVVVMVDDAELILPASDDWSRVRVMDAWLPRTASISLSATDAFVIDAVTVMDRSAYELGPPLVVLAGVLLLTLWVLVSAWRARRA